MKQFLMVATPMQMAILLQMQAENIMETTRQTAEMCVDKRQLASERFEVVVGKFYGIQQVMPLLQSIADFLADKQPQAFIEPTLLHFNHEKQMIEEILQQVPEFRLPETPENIVH